LLGSERIFGILNQLDFTVMVVSAHKWLKTLDFDTWSKWSFNV